MNTILLVIGVSLYCLIFYLIGREDEKIRQSKIERKKMQKEFKEARMIYREKGNPKKVSNTGQFFIIGGKRYPIEREGMKAYKLRDWKYFENLIKEA